MIDRPAAGRAARVPGGGRSLVAPLWSVVLLAGCGAILTGCDSRQDAPEPDDEVGPIGRTRVRALVGSDA